MEQDKFYVLCEFINEDKADADGGDRPVQVAFAEWIKLNTNEPKLPIAKLIEDSKEVTLRWPRNRDVHPKEVMVKKLADVEWMDVVAILKAQSDEWTEIVEASKNLVRYGVPFPPRELRKELAKRKADETSAKRKSEETSVKRKPEENLAKRKADKESAEDVLQEKEQKKKKLKSNKKDGTGLNSKVVGPNVDSEPIVYFSDSADDKCPLSSALLPKKEQKLTKKRRTTIERESVDSYDLSDTDDLEYHATKPALRSKIEMLEEEVKRLKKELFLYKSMKIVSEEFPKVAAKMKELVSQCKASKSSSHSKRHGSSSDHLSRPKDHTSVKPNKPKDFVMTDDIPASLVPERTTVLPIVDLKGTESNKAERPICEIEVKPSTSGLIPDVLNVLDDDTVEKIEIQEDPILLDYKTHLSAAEDSLVSEAANENDDVILFGSKRFSVEQVSKLRHNKVTILAAELLGLIFSPDELALSTLKGKKNNKHNDGVDKSKLDEGRVRSIVEYISKKKMIPIEKVEAEIHTSITNKLNNFKKTEEGKAIIAREKAKVSDTA